MAIAIPPTAAYNVGFKRKDFIPLVSRVNRASRGYLDDHRGRHDVKDQAAVLCVHPG